MSGNDAFFPKGPRPPKQEAAQACSWCPKVALYKWRRQGACKDHFEELRKSQWPDLLRREGKRAVASSRMDMHDRKLRSVQKRARLYNHKAQ